MSDELINSFLGFLREHRLMSISTISSDTGGPQLAFVYYIIDSAGDLFFATTSDSRKIKNIERSNRVAVMVGQEVDPQVAEIEGRAVVVSDMNDRMNLLVRISAVANQNPNSLNMPPLVKLLQRSDLVIVKVIIEKFRYYDFSRDDKFFVSGTQKDLL